MGKDNQNFFNLLLSTTALGIVIVALTTTTTAIQNKVAGTSTQLAYSLNIGSDMYTKQLEPTPAPVEESFTNTTTQTPEPTPPPIEETSSSSQTVTSTTEPTPAPVEETNSNTTTTTTTTTQDNTGTGSTSGNITINRYEDTDPYQARTEQSPTSTNTTPGNEVTFNVDHLPDDTNFNPVPLSGTKPLDSTVEINGRRIDSRGDVFWFTPVELKKGKNKFKIVSRSSNGETVGTTELDVNYVPPKLYLEPEEPEITTTQEEEKTPASPETRLRRVEATSYIPKPEAEDLIDPTIAPLFATPDQKAVVAESVGGPRLFSPSHTDQMGWSNNSNPSFVWEKVEDAVSYKVSLSPLPNNPTQDIGDRTNLSYQNLPEGSWYFGISAVKDDGTTTPPTFQRVLIDRTPPQITSVRLEDVEPTYQNGSLVNIKVRWTDNLFNSPFSQEEKPEVLPTAFLSAQDKTLISQYHQEILPFTRFVNLDLSSLDSKFNPANLMASAPIKIGANEFETTLSYRIDLDNKKADSSKVPINISVSDFAGNATSSQLTVELVNDAPVSLHTAQQTYLVQEEVEKTGIPLSGTTLPNAEVTLSVYSNPVLATFRSDENGNWTYVVREELEVGNHTIYARAEDQLGNKTPEVQVGSFSIIPQAQAAEVRGLVNELAQVAPSEELIGSPFDLAKIGQTSLFEKGGSGLALFALGGILSALAIALLIWHFRQK